MRIVGAPIISDPLIVFGVNVRRIRMTFLVHGNVVLNRRCGLLTYSNSIAARELYVCRHLLSSVAATGQGSVKVPGTAYLQSYESMMGEKTPHPARPGCSVYARRVTPPCAAGGFALYIRKWGREMAVLINRDSGARHLDIELPSRSCKIGRSPRAD